MTIYVPLSQIRPSKGKIMMLLSGINGVGNIKVFKKDIINRLLRAVKRTRALTPKQTKIKEVEE